MYKGLSVQFLVHICNVVHIYLPYSAHLLFIKNMMVTRQRESKYLVHGYAIMQLRWWPLNTERFNSLTK